MLRAWLTEDQHQSLRASRAARAPHAQPAALPPGRSLFDWDMLDRVLSSLPAPDALVVRESQLLEEAPPTSAEGVRALFQRRAGVVVRRAERHDRTLAQLARDLAAELEGEAHVQLFVTPAGTRGFGWHYDQEDVCILQTTGSKTYYLRANTVVDPRLDGAQPDFSRIRLERSPLLTCTLVARDLLYLPRRMWHAARAGDDSFSISVGVR